MEVIIDCREKELIDICKNLLSTEEKFKGIEIQTENLPLGDAIIKYNKMECIIIERKTIKDLIASIKDGRYSDQCFRFHKSSYNPHNIFYLIEGNIPVSSKDKQTIYSSIFSLSCFKGFSIARSFHIQETAYIILNMMLKIKIEDDKGNKRYHPNFHELIHKDTIHNNIIDCREHIDIKQQENTDETNDETNDEEKDKKNTDFTNVIKMKKSETITRENIGVILLCQIPNVNVITANEIIKKCKTIGCLIEKIKEAKTTNNDFSFLYDIKYIHNHKHRKLNKNAIDSIINFLS